MINISFLIKLETKMNDSWTVCNVWFRAQAADEIKLQKWEGETCARRCTWHVVRTTVVVTRKFMCFRVKRRSDGKVLSFEEDKNCANMATFWI